MATSSWSNHKISFQSVLQLLWQLRRITITSVQQVRIAIVHARRRMIRVRSHVMIHNYRGASQSRVDSRMRAMTSHVAEDRDCQSGPGIACTRRVTPFDVKQVLPHEDDR